MYFATLWRIFIEDQLSCHLNKWTLWPRWGGTVSRRPCHCLPERMSLVTLLMLLWNWLPKLLVARITWNSILENFGWWWQWAARWAVCYKRTAPEEMKIYCNFSSRQYKNLRAFFNQNANILGVDNNFFPALWRSRRWPVQATLLLKDGIVLLEHEACQEHWLFSTPSRRGTLPISVGSTTEWLVTSQLYNLSDIVKANSAIRHLHRHSEAARGWSWQCPGGPVTQNQDQI